jgi:hypothetical protein
MIRCGSSMPDLIKFTDTKGKIFELEAPIPKDIRATLQQMEKRKKGK